MNKISQCYNNSCNNEVITGFKTEKFCRACSHSSEQMVIKCTVCSDTFNYSGKGRMTNYCSAICKRMLSNERARIRRNKRRVIKTKECPTCKKQFTKGYSETYNTKYCSLECISYKGKKKAKNLIKGFSNADKFISLPFYLS